MARSCAFAEGMFTRLGALCGAPLRLRAGKVRSKFVHMLEAVKANGIDFD